MDRKKLVVIVVIMLVIIVAILFYIPNRTKLKKTEPNPLPAPTLMQVPFDYTIQSVDEKSIVLNGDQGEVTLHKNAIDISIYKGKRGSKEQADFNALQQGQKVQVDTVPGRSASIYILK